MHASIGPALEDTLLCMLAWHAIGTRIHKHSNGSTLHASVRAAAAIRHAMTCIGHAHSVACKVACIGHTLCYVARWTGTLQ